jgi:tryptophan synthase
MSHGEEKAVQDAKDAGANGFIVVDLPPEEAIKFREICTSTGYVSTYPLFGTFADVLCSISYVPLVAPSTSIGRVKFLAGIADSFIYVVSKVRLSAPLLNTLLIHSFRWELPAQPVTQQ